MDNLRYLSACSHSLEPRQLGSKVLHNFAALQHSRWRAQAAQDKAQAMGLKSGEAEADFSTGNMRDPPDAWPRFLGSSILFRYIYI